MWQLHVPILNTKIKYSKFHVPPTNIRKIGTVQGRYLAKHVKRYINKPNKFTTYNCPPKYSQKECRLTGKKGYKDKYLYLTLAHKNAQPRCKVMKEKEKDKAEAFTITCQALNSGDHYHQVIRIIEVHSRLSWKNINKYINLPN